MTFPCIKCEIRKYTNTKCLKDPTWRPWRSWRSWRPSCTIFPKCSGFKDIKYDIPVCYDGYEGYIYSYIYIYIHIQIQIHIYIEKLTERIVVPLNTILFKGYLAGKIRRNAHRKEECLIFYLSLNTMPI